MREGEGVSTLKFYSIYFDFPDVDLKIKNNETAYQLFHQQRKERVHFSTFKFDPICNNVLYLISGFKGKTDKMTYIQFNNGGGCQLSSLKFDPIYNNFPYL